MDNPLEYIPEEVDESLPSQNDLIKRLGANCFRKSKDTGKSAKDVLRETLGQYGNDGTLVDYTIEELSVLTKKSEINIRTMLSDLRSAKYCGRQGVFLTERIKRQDGKISFRYVPPVAYRDALINKKDVPGLSGTPENPTHDGRGGPYDVNVPKGKPVGVVTTKTPPLPPSMIGQLEEMSQATKKQVLAQERIAREFAAKHPAQDERIKKMEETRLAKKAAGKGRELDESVLKGL